MRNSCDGYTCTATASMSICKAGGRSPLARKSYCRERENQRPAERGVGRHIFFDFYHGSGDLGDSTEYEDDSDEEDDPVSYLLL